MATPLPEGSVGRLRRSALEPSKLAPRPAKARFDPRAPDLPSEAYVTTLLKRCHEASDVLDVYEQEAQAFDLFNFGAAGTALLRLHKARAPHKRDPLPRSRIAGFLGGMVRALEAAPAAPHVGVLASMAWAAANLGLDDPQFWNRLCAGALPQIVTAAKSQDVAHLTAALARAGVRDTAVLAACAQHCSEHTHHYSGLDAAMLGASLVDLDVAHEPAMQAIESVLATSIRNASTAPRDITAVASALVWARRSKRPSSPVVDAAVPYLQANVTRLPPRDLVNTLDALVDLGRPDPLLAARILRAFRHRQRREAATPSDAAQLARAVARLVQELPATVVTSPGEQSQARPSSELEARGRLRELLDVEATGHAISLVLIRHLDPKAAGRDAETLALAEASKAAHESGKPGGPFQRYPTLPVSPRHALHVLEAARDSGWQPSAELAAKTATLIAERARDLQPSEVVRAIAAVVWAAQGHGPRLQEALQALQLRVIKLGPESLAAAGPELARAAQALLDLSPRVPAAKATESLVADAVVLRRSAPWGVASWQSVVTTSPAPQSDRPDEPHVRKLTRMLLRTTAEHASTVAGPELARLVWSAGTSMTAPHDALCQLAETAQRRLLRASSNPNLVAALLLGLAGGGAACTDSLQMQLQSLEYRQTPAHDGSTLTAVPCRLVRSPRSSPPSVSSSSSSWSRATEFWSAAATRTREMLREQGCHSESVSVAAWAVLTSADRDVAHDVAQDVASAVAKVDPAATRPSFLAAEAWTLSQILNKDDRTSTTERDASPWWLVGPAPRAPDRAPLHDSIRRWLAEPDTTWLGKILTQLRTEGWTIDQPASLCSVLHADAVLTHPQRTRGLFVPIIADAGRWAHHSRDGQAIAPLELVRRYLVSKQAQGSIVILEPPVSVEAESVEVCAAQIAQAAERAR